MPMSGIGFGPGGSLVADAGLERRVATKMKMYSARAAAKAVRSSRNNITSPLVRHFAGSLLYHRQPPDSKHQGTDSDVSPFGG